MPLAGRFLSIGWASALCRYVGFKGWALHIAVALMTAESGRYVEAWHDNLNEAGERTSTDRGLFQINDFWHPQLTDEDAYSAIPNAACAFTMSGKGHTFAAWAAYNSGAYRKYLVTVAPVIALGIWRRKVHRIEEELGG